MRISPELFQELLERVGPRLDKRDNFMRKALRPRHRLAIALRYTWLLEIPTKAFHTDHGCATDMLRLRPGVYGYLRFSTVTWGRLRKMPRFFLQILVVQHLYFYFNLFPASESVRMAWKQHVLMVPYGAEFDVLKVLYKTHLRICCKRAIKPCIFWNRVFFTKINVSFI